MAVVIRDSRPSMQRYACSTHESFLAASSLPGLSRSCLLCSDTLDIAIAALEQRIRDVEADIGKAQFEVESAQAEGIDEDVRFWRAEKLQLRTKKKRLRDEIARKEVLQQGTPLHTYIHHR